MRDHTVTDDYGRRTSFTGEKLVAESTDTGSKPQWLDITIWGTKAGHFVARRETHYRVRHTTESCPRAVGYEIIDATEIDTYPCATCNREGRPGGFAQASRVAVDVYLTPEELIESLKIDGRHNSLARTVLADISEQDDRVDAIWNEVRVP